MTPLITITAEQAKSVTVALLGVSGWGVVALKFLLDIREDRRKQREERRKQAEEKVRIAERLAPFVTQLNSGEYLGYYAQIASGNKERQDPWILRRYPAELEGIGALMLTGVVPVAAVYDNFGDEILTCSSATFLWEGEDMHYWKVFQLMAEKMGRERESRDLDSRGRSSSSLRAEGFSSTT